MPNLTIIVTTQQAARTMASFGHLDTSRDPAIWVNATTVEIQAAIKAWARLKVEEYEATLEAIASRATKSAEVW